MKKGMLDHVTISLVDPALLKVMAEDSIYSAWNILAALHGVDTARDILKGWAEAFHKVATENPAQELPSGLREMVLEGMEKDLSEKVMQEKALLKSVDLN